MALFARSAKSTHFLAEREENRLKIQYYNWTPKLSPLADKWQHDWIASGVFEEGANSSRHALRCLVPTTLQQLLGAFSSPRQINDNSIPGSPGIDIGTAPYYHRLLLRLNPLTPNTTCPVAPMQAPPTNHITHYHYHAAPPIPSHGGFPGRPRTLSLFPLFFSPARNTNSAIPMPLGPINQIAIATGPRLTHGGYSPPALHQPANHTQTNSSAYPRALKKGGRRRRTPPTTTTITGNTSTRTQTIKSGQHTLLNPSPRLQNYTTPPHHRGLPPVAATPPIRGVGGWEGPPVCWCPPWCGAPLRAPRGVVCPPVVGACPVCCPPLRWVLAPYAGAPPRCCGPDQDRCYDRLVATAPHRIHSLAPWRHQGSGHPHAYRSCVRRAGTVHAVIHSPQQAFSQKSSGAAASRSRSHSSATNMVSAPVTLP